MACNRYILIKKNPQNLFLLGQFGVEQFQGGKAARNGRLGQPQPSHRAIPAPTIDDGETNKPHLWSPSIEATLQHRTPSSTKSAKSASLITTIYGSPSPPTQKNPRNLSPNPRNLRFKLPPNLRNLRLKIPLNYHHLR